MGKIVADLHIHTTYSDGSLNPYELIKRLKDTEATHFSVTDHDNCGAYKELYKGLKHEDLTLIPGIEFSTKDNKEIGHKDIHILGYYIDTDCKELKDYSNHIRDGRYKEKKALVENLSEIGYPIKWSDVTKRVKGYFFGKPHVVEAVLDNLGLFGEERQLKKEKIYRDTRQFDLPRKGSIDFEEVIKFIHRLGGIAVLAHPGAYKDYSRVMERAIACGIDGLEVQYDYSYIKKLGLPQLENEKEFIGELNRIVEEKNFVVAGGSDYHGDHKTISVMSAGLNVEELVRFVELAQKKKSNNN
jgi:predicted metal-dependent phosphoesterase TrpH